jgi:hypothetical protein
MSVAIPLMPHPLPSDIARLEAAIGGALPEGYLEFVRSHDGATPESNSIAIGSNNESGVRCFIPVAEAVSLIGEIEGFPSAAAPLAEDGCGNYFYVKIGSGSVFFWDHEVDGGDIVVAPTLAEFLSSLLPFNHSTMKLAPGHVKYAWIDPAFKPQFD